MQPAVTGGHALGRDRAARLDECEEHPTRVNIAGLQLQACNPFQETSGHALDVSLGTKEKEEQCLRVRDLPFTQHSMVSQSAWRPSLQDCLPYGGYSRNCGIAIRACPPNTPLKADDRKPAWRRACLA